MQNGILIAGAETRRTFAKDEERKYPGDDPAGQFSVKPSVSCVHSSVPAVC